MAAAVSHTPTMNLKNSSRLPDFPLINSVIKSTTFNDHKIDIIHSVNVNPVKIPPV
jgi:hypothetical protein